MNLYHYSVKPKHLRFVPINIVAGFIVADNKDAARDYLHELWFEDYAGEIPTVKIKLRKYAAEESSTLQLQIVLPPLITDQRAMDTYRHRKGGVYELIGIGHLQATGWTKPANNDAMEMDADMTEMAIYRSVLDSSLWCRPLSEWQDGRFEAVL